MEQIFVIHAATTMLLLFTLTNEAHVSPAIFRRHVLFPKKAVCLRSPKIDLRLAITEKLPSVQQHNLSLKN
jgi:hypothetical protein